MASTSRAPIRKHRVGPNINIDLAARQALLLVEPSAVLGNLISVASLHEGIPQQHREAMMVQTPRAQLAVLVGAV
jgi:hypothetical protein